MQRKNCVTTTPYRVAQRVGQARAAERRCQIHHQQARPQPAGVGGPALRAQPGAVGEGRGRVGMGVMGVAIDGWWAGDVMGLWVLIMDVSYGC